MTHVHVISTGSQGNLSEVNEDFFVDLGISKKTFCAEKNTSKLMFKVSAAFITHEHKDHADPSMVRYLCEMRPDIARNQLFMPEKTFNLLSKQSKSLAELIKYAHIIKAGDVVEFKTKNGVYAAEALEAPHGSAECLSFIFTSPQNETIAWATDTEKFNFPNKRFDVLCIEGNWDETLLTAALANPETEAHALSSLRHSSVQSFEKFVRSHRKSNSTIIQLHMSSSFGVRSDLNNTEEV